MGFLDDIPATDDRRRALYEAHRLDEGTVVRGLLDAARLPEATAARIAGRAAGFVETARATRRDRGGLEAFLHEYALSSEEGIVLMCLAEALLRIPDAETADLLIRDKLSRADWRAHLGRSESLFVNASTWGLMLTGRFIRLGESDESLSGTLGRILAEAGEPAIRQAMIQAMRILGHQFVMGRTIAEALERSAEDDGAGDRYSYDMLGEAARTAADADRYFDAYAAAIAAIGAAAPGVDPVARPGISVKLSALHPRYEAGQHGRVKKTLVPRLAALARMAREAEIGLTVDAEEAARLDLSLDVFEAVLRERAFAGYDGIGLALQAYQKRALPAIGWLEDLARTAGRRIPVRLVKGAYWDSEIKRAQEQGLPLYPVFTRKPSTDVSYIACARRLIAAPDAFFPQFATHNAHTAATIIELAGAAGAAFEFQRLHGMGEDLHRQIAADHPVRIYAPVGSHEDLLPYLVRRLLENGANTSFVNRMSDEDVPVAAIVADPVAKTESRRQIENPAIPAPRALFPDGRRNSGGYDLSDPTVLAELRAAMSAAADEPWDASPLIAGEGRAGEPVEALDPADNRRVVGTVIAASPAAVDEAMDAARAAFADWDAAGGDARAEILERVADRLEEDAPGFMAVCIREGGKSIPDSISEVREAVDFCRYYARGARATFAAPADLPGPTGEDNTLACRGRGVFACISPWNFPLAIFTGQIAAALAAGNAVVAKPAEQTPLVAARMVRLMHAAGVPAEVLHLLPGEGETVGAALVAHPGVAGVAFTGSTDVARAINRTLAARDGPIVPLIAETGGQNAMIVDSSALTEQVVGDVITSAFLSAGQRCSALRVLYLQDDIADRTLAMLCGAMEELRIGDPARLGNDVGPVIDRAAADALEDHVEALATAGELLYRCRLGDECAHGSFFAPQAFEIPTMDLLTRENFGPVLHVVRFDEDALDDVLAEIRRSAYGLTLGIHSRIDSTINRIVAAMPVGNVYVNRSMVGAVVGVQPFGGEGLSGTGPKAGGPHYLQRFAVERSLSVNTAAMGGNAALLSLGEERDE